MINKIKFLKAKFLRDLRPHFNQRVNLSSFSTNLNHFKIEKEFKKNNKNKNILIATSTGSNWTLSSFEAILGLALKLRGYSVSFLLCDGALGACQECDHQWISAKDIIQNKIKKKLCNTCFKPAYEMLKHLGLPIFKFSDFLTQLHFKASSSHISHAKAGALRFMGKGEVDFTKDPNNKIFNKFLHSAQITQNVIENLIKENNIDIAIFHHGIYVPQGVIRDTLFKSKISLVNWGISYRKKTVIFSHDNSYHFTMLDEPVSLWNKIKLDKVKESKLIKYLYSRRYGSNDWITFQKGNNNQDFSSLHFLKLDKSKKIVTLLTNVMWDAQLHFKTSAFKSMLDWIFFTIDYFSINKSVQLVIRIHPAEIHGSVPSRQFVEEEINKKYKKLSNNIKIVDPNNKLSTYILAEKSNAILVYGTKAAIELACLGKNIIVSGDSWARGKGFTYDAANPKDYIKYLKKIPFKNDLNNKKKLLAKKYAYHLFFRRMIPVKFLSPSNFFGPYHFKINSIDQLLPGFDPGLDKICDSILNKKPFIYDED